MALSDVVLDFGHGARGDLGDAARPIYATFAAIVLAGRCLRERRGPGPARRRSRSARRCSSSSRRTSRSGSAIRSTRRPPAGLALCFAAAIPFFWNTLAADLLGHGDALRARRALAAPALARGRARPSPSALWLLAARRRAPPAGPAGLRGRRRHGDVGSRGREGRRLGDHGDHARGDREDEIGRSSPTLLRSVPGLDVDAVRHAGLADVALHARHQLDADARPRRRRADELAVLRRATTGPA